MDIVTEYQAYPQRNDKVKPVSGLPAAETASTPAQLTPRYMKVRQKLGTVQLQK
jgi:hypothetical protein